MADLLLRTAQQVPLKFSLAKPISRAIALVLDSFFLAFSFFLWMLFLTELLGIQGQPLNWVIMPSVIFWSLYHFWFEWLWRGQSLGKQIMGLRVICDDGAPPDFQTAIMRWLMRFVDVTLTFGSLGGLFIWGSTKNQRLGDVMAHTFVVSVRTNWLVSLGQLQKALEQQVPEVVFPEAKQLSESQILLVRRLLGQRNEYTAEVYAKLEEDCCQRLATALDVALPEEGARRKFLGQVVQDYIILTR